MIEDFDKEIDAFLRQSARRETAFAADNRKPEIQNLKSEHLDADEISLFAENALPEKAKAVYTKHFADCERCRKILSNVVSQNSETRAETVHAKEIKLAAAASIPWYRRFFAAPNTAYALGALVLIFGALMALTFLKSVPQSSEISQTREAPSGNMNGASSSSDGETKTIESNATTNSASAMSNAGSMMSNASTTNSAVVSNAPSAASTTNNSSFSKSVTTNKQSVQKSEPQKSETKKSDAPVENNSVAAKKDETQLQAGAMNLAERKGTASDNDETILVAGSPAKSAAADAPAISAKPQMRVSAGRAAPPAKQNRIMKAENVETRQSGGKTFRRENNVWYDAAYDGQSTANVRRGSEDFKKLDTGLRSIADSLGGTLVVVWKGKAYRIQ